VLGASLVGFHVPEYAHNFMDCVEHELGLYCDRHRMRVKVPDGDGERWVQVSAFPIGIDPQPIYDHLDDEVVVQRAAALKKQAGGKYLVCGVDRLDYTKGLVQRVRAIETFFDRYPHRQGEVSVVQVAVPSREQLGAYQDIRAELEQRSGHINGLFARPGWTPFTLMVRSLPFDELVSLYSASDVALVTPLRDGMNLVAKEFVAAHRGRGGVLVLSELAGAAQQLTEAELVNPYHVDEIADAIERAISLDEKRQARRMKKMNAKIQKTDVAWWVDSFLSEALYVD
jgi:trehalose-6-phosphate synthase